MGSLFCILYFSRSWFLNKLTVIHIYRFIILHIYRYKARSNNSCFNEVVFDGDSSMQAGLFRPDAAFLLDEKFTFFRDFLVVEFFHQMVERGFFNSDYESFFFVVVNHFCRLLERLLTFQIWNQSPLDGIDFFGVANLIEAGRSRTVVDFQRVKARIGAKNRRTDVAIRNWSTMAVLFWLVSCHCCFRVWLDDGHAFRHDI